MITITDLNFSYTGKKPYLLSEINLNVPKGAYISIVGNNGCGKSTLLRLILKFMLPTHGSIRINASRIGYVPQKKDTDSAFPITVKEVIHSYGRILHLHSIDVRSILSVTGMESQAEELVGNLSGGQYQRMLIARALMGNPDLLILDEPSTGVDVSSQKEIYAVLHRLNAEQKLTILAVEHNLYAAARYSSMLYHIANGHGHLCTPQHYLDEYMTREGSFHA